MRKCNRAGCSNNARWRLGFKVWAIGHSKSSVPLEATVGLVLCDDHKADATPSWLLTPEGIALINAELAKRGKAPINPASAELTFETFN
jgi:hypothetical protein